jgi:hypothetical protein
MFGSANTATRSGRPNMLRLSFSAPFFGSFFGRVKNEQKKCFKTKKVTWIWIQIPEPGYLTALCTRF